MDPVLLKQLKETVKGDVATDDETLRAHSFDKSIFEVKPQAIVYPKNGLDVCRLVRFVAKNKKKYPKLSLTARAAGTCMSGGDLNTSIIVNFMKYFTHNPTVHGKDQTAIVEPGLFYRDFEKETLKHKLIFAPYPSSREICAMGGIVNNNAGGEKSLEYGKTENYVEELNMVLADGNEYTIKPLTEAQLKKKMQQKNFEGQIYKKMFKLVLGNYELIMKSKPDVSKNSAGYYLWNVYDRDKNIFDLTKLFVGAQGTLGLMTKAKLKLVPIRKHAEMLILYVKDYSHLAEIVNVILPFEPESLESYDDVTLKLALKYYADFAKKMGKNVFQTALQFLPEFQMELFGKLPKLTIQAEFTGDEYSEISEKIKRVEEKLAPFNLKMKWAKNEKREEKYWHIRHDSFGLLSSKIKEMYSSPFVDDVVIKIEHLPEFLPKFINIINKYPSIKETFAGHVGNGNFHVIPLVNLKDPKEQKLIFKICEEVFALVKEYKGSTSGEHNDGWIRTPYLKMQFEPKIIKLFEETKKIFDPENIFNPHKKVDGNLDFAIEHIRTSW